MIPLQHAPSRCFVYGTLMSQDVLRTLLGRVPEMDPRPAFLPPEYSRHPVKGHVFPGVIVNQNTNTNNEQVKGILLSGITAEEIEIFDFFEDVAYERRKVDVLLQPEKGDADTIDADLYLWTEGDHLLELESSWSFEDFCIHKLPWYLRSTVRPCKEEYDNQMKQR